MSRNKRHHTTDRLRNLSLSNVLISIGAQQNRHDRSKWQTPLGILTITGTKFFNWSTESGGGGAIDLVMHLKQCSFNEALEWLDHTVQNGDHTLGKSNTNISPETASYLAVPRPSIERLSQVKTYLIQERHLQRSSLQPHIHNGTLYADARANAVMLLQSPTGTTVGAELRGTTGTWRGMARGTRKDQGYFSTPTTVIEDSSIMLCESAIDAISYNVMHPGNQCISTAGARANPVWLHALLVTGRPIYCGYDNDEAGEKAARTMISLHPFIQRRRPARHDWNEDLKHQF